MFTNYQHTRETHDAGLFRKSVFFSISTTAAMWLIKLFEWSMNSDLGFLGIYPRTLKGTIGILTAPLIHGDIFHLLSNTLPYISLTLILFYIYSKIALEVFIWIYLVTGIWVWAFARDAYHIGASGIVYGLASFLLFSGFLTRNIRLIALSMVILFLYGGMFYGISPTTVSQNVSWESHLLGALSGILLSLYFRKKIITDSISKIAIEETKPPVSSTSEKTTEFIYHYKEKTDNKN